MVFGYRKRNELQPSICEACINFFYLPFNMFTLLLLALKVFAFYEIKKIFLDSSAVVDTNEINAHNNAVPFLKSSYLQIWRHYLRKLKLLYCFWQFLVIWTIITYTGFIKLKKCYFHQTEYLSGVFLFWYIPT